MVKKPVVIWWRRCVIDMWEKTKVNLIGLTNFISTVIEPNLTSCQHPLDEKLENLALLVHIFRCIPMYCSKTWLNQILHKTNGDHVTNTHVTSLDVFIE